MKSSLLVTIQEHKTNESLDEKAENSCKNLLAARLLTACACSTADPRARLQRLARMARHQLHGWNPRARWRWNPSYGGAGRPPTALHQSRWTSSLLGGGRLPVAVPSPAAASRAWVLAGGGAGWPPTARPRRRWATYCSLWRYPSPAAASQADECSQVAAL
jgi:hypothetical protein